MSITAEMLSAHCNHKHNLKTCCLVKNYDLGAVFICSSTVSANAKVGGMTKVYELPKPNVCV